MNDADARTPEPTQTTEQPQGTPQVQTPEQPTGQDSDSFTQVDLTQIDRDSLSEELRPAYDQLVTMRSNMNKDYTQKAQALSAERSEIDTVKRDAELWRFVQSHPVIGQRLGQMLERANSGLPIEEEQVAQPVSAPQIDAERDPEAYLESIMERVIEKRLGKDMQDIRAGIQGVTGFVRTNQAQLEFENLCTKYPAAEALGIERLNQVRSQYLTSGGQPIPMQRALGILALDNPALLSPPPTTIPVPQKPPTVPPVERPVSSLPTTPTARLPQGVKVLQRKVDEHREAGRRLTVREMAEYALENFRGGGQ